MNTFAYVVADTVSPGGARITTMSLTYPRIIHGEFMTHRVFSRNSMSSRAIPTPKLIAQVRDTPFVPQHIVRNIPGMQGGADMYGAERTAVLAEWHAAAKVAADAAERMHALGVHKQVANRVLEPFQWMRTVVTATEWTNFFKLRCHPDAEPHFQYLATDMQEALRSSPPQKACSHLPYVDDELEGDLPLQSRMKLSAARCARVSYSNHDGTPVEHVKDFALADTLIEAGHFSPFEHAATAHVGHDEFVANLRGWQSYRSRLGA